MNEYVKLAAAVIVFRKLAEKGAPVGGGLKNFPGSTPVPRSIPSLNLPQAPSYTPPPVVNSSGTTQTSANALRALQSYMS
jgi:hypothetical protein